MHVVVQYAFNQKVVLIGMRRNIYDHLIAENDTIAQIDHHFPEKDISN